jgi:hypothetical protein
MADTVTTQVLENGPKRLVVKCTNFSDGTGESGVTKVNATSSGSFGVVVQGQTFYPGLHLKITDIWYDVHGGGLRIQWHASSNVDILVLGGFGHWRFSDVRAGFQGLVNTAASGATGSIDFTTVGFTNVWAGSAVATVPYSGGYSGYTVILELNKGIPSA